MSESTLVRDNFSTVGFKYRARLSRSERLPQLDRDGVAVGNGRASHGMHISGQVHPSPYTHKAARELAERKLEPLVTLGWEVQSLVVTGYAEKDA